MGWFITTKIRRRAATLALGATIGLTIFKLAAGIISGSVGVFSEGIHSFLDLVSATLSYFTVPRSVRPADKDHPFGHGKIETLSSLFESLLLVVAAGLITFEGVDHWNHPQPLHHLGLAMGVILVSIVVSYYMYRHNHEAAGLAESSALHVNALHFLSDVVASAGVLVGLIVLRLTGWLLIDPIMAFTVAVYILLISAKQVKAALMELSDVQLPDTEIAEIRYIVESFQDRIIEAHDFRTRRGGMTRYIDFHLVVCGLITVEESHAVCDQIEARIEEKFRGASVTIHVEPCEWQNTGCRKSCPNFNAKSLIPPTSEMGK